MRGTLKTALVLALASSPAAAQVVLLSSASWNGGSADSAQAAAVAPNGDLYVVGRSSRGAGDFDVWLARFSTAPALLSTATFNGSANGTDMGAELAIGPDGSVYVVGKSSVAGGVQPWLGKFDANLGFISSHTVSGGIGFDVNSLEGIKLSGGQLWVAGHYKHAFATNNKGKIWVGKFDTDLNLLASATYWNGFDLNVAADIELDEAGGVYVAGSLPPALLTSSDAWLGKFSAALANAANYTRAGAAGHSDQLLSVISDRAGTLYASGDLINSGVTSDAYLVKLNTSLTALSSATLAGSAGASDSGKSLAFGATGRLLVAGGVSQTGQGLDVWLAEYDTSLALRSSATYNQSGASSDQAEDVVVDAGRGVAWVVGSITAADQDAWVARYGVTAEALASLGLSSVATTSLIAGWSGSFGSVTVEASTSPFPNALPGNVSVSTGNQSAVLGGLTPGLLYHVQVSTPGGGAVPLGSAATLAEAPVLSVTSVGTTTASLSWTAGANAPGLVYALRRSTDGGGSYVTRASATALSSYGDSGLSAGATYTYQVVAFNQAGAPSYSAPASTRTSPAPTGFWTGPAADQAAAIARAPDGTLYVAGRSSQGAAGDDIWVGRFGASLALMDYALVNGTGDGTDFADDVAVAADGAVYVVGRASYTGLGVQPWIGKFDAALNLISSRTYMQGAGEANNSAQAVEFASNGDLWIAGQSRLLPGQSPIWLARFDPDLNLLQGTTYHNGVQQNMAMDLSVGDGYVFVGGAMPPAFGQSSDAYLARFNETTLVLEQLVTKAGAAGHSDHFTDVLADGNGNVYAAGEIINSGTTSDGFIIKYSTGLTQLASVNVAGSGGNIDGVKGLALGVGGRLVVAGYLTQTGQSQDVWYGEYDASLNLLSTATYNRASLVDRAESVVVDTANAVAYAAGMSDGGAGLDVWVGRFGVFAGSITAGGFSSVSHDSLTAFWSGPFPSYTAVLSTQAFPNSNPGNAAQTVAAPSASFSGLTPSTLYHAQVSTAGGAPVSLGSTVTLAAQPVVSVGSVTAFTATLAWTTGGNPAGLLYVLERSTDGAAYVAVASGSITGFNDAGLAAATSYYYRAAAYNLAGTPSYSAPVSTRTAAPPGSAGAPGAPAGTALGVSSISWTWSLAANATGYQVLRPSDGALLASTAAAAFVQTGLAPNTAYGLAARGVNEVGAGPLSPAGTAYTLANAPSGTAASAVQASSATVSWGLNGNPAATTAEVQRSTDGAAYSTVAAGQVTSITDTGLLGCTTYWYRVRNQNGNGLLTGFDSAVGFKTLNTTPTAATSFIAEPAAGGRVALSWGASPTEGVTGYRLYYDAGAGTVSFGSPLAVFTSTESAWTTGVLVSSPSYKFTLRAVHRCGVEETAGVSAFSGAVAAPAAVRAAVKTPAAGKRIHGNRVTVHAEIVSGAPADAASVRFQYRASGASSWTDITAANLNHPNPDVEAPFFVHWNVTALGSGGYDLRAVATDVSGSSDTAPAAVTVVIDAAQPDISESEVNGKVKKDELVSSAVPALLEAAGQAADDPAVRLRLPDNAVSASTVTVSLLPNPAITSAPVSGFESVGSMVSITLGNGQKNLSNGRTAALTLTYPASVRNPERLEIHHFNDASGRWEREFATVVNVTSRTVTCHTPHFSIFGVFNPISVAAGGLSGVRVYPNPYRPNSGNPDLGKPYSAGDPTSGVVFDNLPANVRLVIYTPTGRKVAEFEQSAGNGTVRWDGRNEDGRDVASGVYLAVITSPGEKPVTKRVAVIR